MNGGCSVLNGRFIPVASDQDTVRTQADRFVVQNRHRQWIHGRFAAITIDHSQHILKRLAECFLRRPARHAFGDRIEIGDVAGDVGADDCIPD
jgi:hypothetical protein